MLLEWKNPSLGLDDLNEIVKEVKMSCSKPLVHGLDSPMSKVKVFDVSSEAALEFPVKMRQLTKLEVCQKTDSRSENKSSRISNFQTDNELGPHSKLNKDEYIWDDLIMNKASVKAEYRSDTDKNVVYLPTLTVPFDTTVETAKVVLESSEHELEVGRRSKKENNRRSKDEVVEVVDEDGFSSEVSKTLLKKWMNQENLANIQSESMTSSTEAKAVSEELPGFKMNIPYRGCYSDTVDHHEIPSVELLDSLTLSDEGQSECILQNPNFDYSHKMGQKRGVNDLSVSESHSLSSKKYEDSKTDSDHRARRANPTVIQESKLVRKFVSKLVEEFDVNGPRLGINENDDSCFKDRSDIEDFLKKFDESFTTDIICNDYHKKSEEYLSSKSSHSGEQKAKHEVKEVEEEFEQAFKDYFEESNQFLEENIKSNTNSASKGKVTNQVSNPATKESSKDDLSSKEKKQKTARRDIRKVKKKSSSEIREDNLKFTNDEEIAFKYEEHKERSGNLKTKSSSTKRNKLIAVDEQSSENATFHSGNERPPVQTTRSTADVHESNSNSKIVNHDNRKPKRKRRKRKNRQRSKLSELRTDDTLAKVLDITCEEPDQNDPLLNSQNKNAEAHSCAEYNATDADKLKRQLSNLDVENESCDNRELDIFESNEYKEEAQNIEETKANIETCNEDKKDLIIEDVEICKTETEVLTDNRNTTKKLDTLLGIKSVTKLQKETLKEKMDRLLIVNTLEAEAFTGIDEEDLLDSYVQLKENMEDVIEKGKESPRLIRTCSPRLPSDSESLADFIEMEKQASISILTDDIPIVMKEKLDNLYDDAKLVGKHKFGLDLSSGKSDMEKEKLRDLAKEGAREKKKVEALVLSSNKPPISKTSKVESESVDIKKQQILARSASKCNINMKTITTIKKLATSRISTGRKVIRSASTASVNSDTPKPITNQLKALQRIRNESKAKVETGVRRSSSTASVSSLMSHRSKSSEGGTTSKVLQKIKDETKPKVNSTKRSQSSASINSLPPTTNRQLNLNLKTITRIKTMAQSRIDTGVKKRTVVGNQREEKEHKIFDTESLFSYEDRYDGSPIEGEFGSERGDSNILPYNLEGNSKDCELERSSMENSIPDEKDLGKINRTYSNTNKHDFKTPEPKNESVFGVKSALRTRSRKPNKPNVSSVQKKAFQSSSPSGFSKSSISSSKLPSNDLGIGSSKKRPTSYRSVPTSSASLSKQIDKSNQTQPTKNEIIATSNSKKRSSGDQCPMNESRRSKSSHSSQSSMADATSFSSDSNNKKSSLARQVMEKKFKKERKKSKHTSELSSSNWNSNTLSNSPLQSEVRDVVSSENNSMPCYSSSLSNHKTDSNDDQIDVAESTSTTTSPGSELNTSFVVTEDAFSFNTPPLSSKQRGDSCCPSGAIETDSNETHTDDKEHGVHNPLIPGAILKLSESSESLSGHDSSKSPTT